jgi:hypothetical protein
MKKNNGKVSQKKAKRHLKNVKRLSGKDKKGHYLDKFRTTMDLTPEQTLTDEQRANAEKALLESLGIHDRDTLAGVANEKA